MNSNNSLLNIIDIFYNNEAIDQMNIDLDEVVFYNNNHYSKVFITRLGISLTSYIHTNEEVVSYEEIKSIINKQDL